MLISKEVPLEINKGNINFYKKTFYSIKVGDVINISVNDLTKSSSINVVAKCDICSSTKTIKYKLYLKSYNIDNLFCCSRKCSSEKNKRKLIDLYGVSNISLVPGVKEKIINTNINNWGTHSYLCSDFGKKKIKNTLLNKYGVDNPQKNNEIKNKTKITNNKKYGFDYVLQSDEIRDKIRKTNLDKYGYEYPSMSNSIKSKIIDTNNKKYGNNCPLSNFDILNKSKITLNLNYGVDSPLKSDIIKEKVKNTNLLKRNCEWPMQSNDVKNILLDNNKDKYGNFFLSHNEEFRKNNYHISNDINYINYIENSISLFKCDLGKDHEFKIHYDNYHKRTQQNIPLCTICNPISESSSIKEEELFNFINSIYDGDIIRNYRDNLEIDIFIPKLKIGFEFNGLYWHSDQWKEKNYHFNKSNFFSDKGIQIIHIWEDDWSNKKDIIKSMIMSKLNLINKKLYARKCSIQEIRDTRTIRNFLNTNHIQGYVNSVIKLGLYFDNELVGIMTFDNFEGRKKIDGWNLSRFCTINNCNIIGGASKLLKYFIKKWDPSRIISYADRDWSNGNLYKKIGFNEIKSTLPDYKYIINNNRIHKSRFRKSKIGLSESKFIEMNNIRKIWDTGKIKYEILKK